MTAQRMLEPLPEIVAAAHHPRGFRQGESDAITDSDDPVGVFGAVLRLVVERRAHARIAVEIHRGAVTVGAGTDTLYTYQLRPET